VSITIIPCGTVTLAARKTYCLHGLKMEVICSSNNGRMEGGSHIPIFLLFFFFFFLNYLDFRLIIPVPPTLVQELADMVDSTE
jgi:hypothetical protein